MPEKEKAKGKKPKTTKTDEQLTAEYRKRVVNAVDSIDRQYLKLKRAFKSKKANLSDEEKAKILAHIDKTVSGFQKAITSEEADESGFKL